MLASRHVSCSRARTMVPRRNHPAPTPRAPRTDPPQSSVSRPLQSFVTRCEVTWPNLAIDRTEFIAWLSKELPDSEAARLREPHATDLFVAYGCARHSPTALRAFDEEFLSHVARYVERIDKSAAFAAEVRQELRHRLLVAHDGGLPTIARYRAHGPLGGWLRAAAQRTALNLKRARQGDVDTDLADLEGATVDPEMAYVQATYVHEFSAALETVITSLPDADREILRLHYLEGQNIEQVGAKVGVHRATVARHLLRIREVVLAAVRELLRARLDLKDDELEALVGFATDGANVSVARMLMAPKR